jgi:hypothetical protein
MGGYAKILCAGLLPVKNRPCKSKFGFFAIFTEWKTSFLEVIFAGQSDFPIHSPNHLKGPIFFFPNHLRFRQDAYM